MLYWEGQAKRLSLIDSLNSGALNDCESALRFSNEKIKEQSLVVDSLKNENAQQRESLNNEIERKKRWRRATAISIPLSVLTGLVLSLFL
jgi:cell shape-determining protein MreC